MDGLNCVYTEVKSTSSFHVPSRGHASTWASAIVFVAYFLFIACCVVTGDAFPDHHTGTIDHITYMTCAVLFGGTVLILAELLYRTVLLVEEVRHKRTRYHNSLGRVLCEVYTAKYGAAWIGLILVFVLMMLFLTFQTHLADFVHDYMKANVILLVTQLVLNSVVLAMIGVRGPSKVEMSRLVEKNHLNVGHGLAWSYYMGYLRFVLPELESRLVRSPPLVATGDRVIPKMVVLLPENCQAPSKLGEDDSMVDLHSQVELLLDRAGKSKRSFSQPLYKITDKTCSYYCVVEYSASLQTLADMCGETNSGLRNQEMKYQMKIFYQTLQRILVDNKMADKVLLLPFEDNTVGGTDGQTSIPLSSFLLDYIRSERPIPQRENVTTA